MKCINDYLNENSYLLRDLSLFSYAAKQFRENPLARDGILFKCINEDEAIYYKKIMKKLYPDVKVFTQWYVFIDKKEKEKYEKNND